MGFNTKDDHPLDHPSKPRHQQQQELLRCPRCQSNNTKFCYYNNYNKSQPRHFCKSCKRHWTQGGILRNVPMGGARKNKRPAKTTTTTTTTTTATAVAAATTNTRATFPNIGNDNETLSTVLYRALVCSDPCEASTSIDTVTPVKPPQNLNGEYPTSIVDDENVNLSCSHATYLQPIIDHYPDMEPTMTPTTSTVTWSNLNDVMDLSNCWNWDEIDKYAPFGNSSEFNIAWDDVYSERKP